MSTTTTTVATTTNLPTGPIPSFPSSNGVSIALSKETPSFFFTAISFILDGDPSPTSGT